jgi:hypothetical protein
MKDEIYEKVWGKENGYVDGIFKVGKDKFVVSGTAYGDGCYMDNLGNKYGVDAGVIGIVPKCMWKCTEKEIKKRELGTVLKIKNELTFEVPKEGTFRIFADKELIVINTS